MLFLPALWRFAAVLCDLLIEFDGFGDQQGRVFSKLQRHSREQVGGDFPNAFLVYEIALVDFRANSES